MKIAHVIWSLGIGGIETMISDIINIQVKEDEVRLYVVNDLIDENIYKSIDKRCKLICCHRKIGSYNPLAFLKLNILIYKYSPDIIHLHMPRLRRFLFTNKKIVYTNHHVFASKEFHHYDKIFSISESVKNYVTSKGYNSVTILNGIKFDNIHIKETYKRNGAFRIVQVGRLLHSIKGQHLLIKAVKELQLKYAINDVFVDFIGEGPSLMYLTNLVRTEDLSDKVKFLGAKSRIEVYHTLNSYDLFCQPSIDEGFGLTIAEAMAAKLPVLVSDLPATMEVIDNGRLGAYFKTGNIDSLVDQLKILHDREVNVNQIEKAYEYALKKYDIRITANKYLTEYQKVISVN